MGALDAVKRMSDVLPQLSADSAQQFYPPTHGAADTHAHPVIAAIRTADGALGNARTCQWTDPTSSCTTVHPSIPRVRSPRGRPARSLVDGKRCRTVWKGSSSSFGLYASVAPGESPIPSASTPFTTGSGIGHGWLATASQSFAPLQASGAGIRLGLSYDRRLRLGGGQTERSLEHPGHARRRGLEHAMPTRSA